MDRPEASSYPSRCAPNRLRPPLDDRQRALATRYLPLARSLARKMSTYHPMGRDEFKSAAFLALVMSAQSFDSTHGVGYAAYARHRIWGALRDVRRELLKRKGASIGSAPRAVISLSSVEDWQDRCLDVIAEEPVGSDMEAAETVEAWIARLPGPHSRALRLIYVDGRTQEEAAVAAGCSKANMSRLHQEGLRWLRYGHGPRRDRSAASSDVAIDACA